ncbi:MAG: D-alanine--D-alanine ligase family protein [Geminicoccaceae bacterium]
MELRCQETDNIAAAANGDVGNTPRRQSRVEALENQIARLKESMRIAVVFGGDKCVDGAVINRTSNPRSWKSYESVAEDIAAGLRRLGFHFVTTMPDDMYLGERLRREGIHFAWLNTGGVQGIGSVAHAPAMLEMFGIPYVGHNPLNAAMLDNKHVLKRDLALAGIPTAPFLVWQSWRDSLVPKTDARFRAVFGGYEGPFVVKPVSGRASHHVTVVDAVNELTTVVDHVHALTENAVLIERYLSGREFCVSVCGEVISRRGHFTRLGGPFAFGTVERVLDPEEQIFTSMDQRPITVDRVRSLDSEVDSKDIEELKALACQIFAELDVETLIRLDVRADEDGRLFVLEANPKPDLAAPTADRTSIVCSGLAIEGMTYDDLILSLLADRIDVLFSQRRSAVNNLVALLN